MAAVQPTGPVADFCKALGRVVRACGVPQKVIAQRIAKSDSTVSALLNGHRVTKPDWPDVRLIVGLCAERKSTAPPPGVNLDVRWWKRRYEELEWLLETPGARAPAPSVPEAPAPLPRLDPTEYVAMDVVEAMHMLSGGRRSSPAAVDALMDPLGGVCSRPPLLDDLLARFPERVRAAHGAARGALIQAARVVLMAVALAPYENFRREADRMIRDLADGMHLTYASPFADFQDSVTEETASGIIRDYLALATPLAASCPEFALAAGLSHAVPDDRTSGPPGTGLAGLGELLAGFAEGDGRSVGGGARLLRAPIASLDSPGPQLPSLAEGYVNPRFRLATGRARDGIASDKWWERQPAYDDIEEFLAAHLLGLPALLTPLVVLGHPGAGKSLLTKLLTERLPRSEFRPVRVELRHTPAEADVQTQVEYALRQSGEEPENWRDWYGTGSGALPVVLLDGFDELLQAGAQKLDSARQWGYLRQVQAFQEAEARAGRPLIVIVTSRTVVADRAEVPHASPVVRLEPFEEPEVERWLAIWNATNAGYFARHRLRPLDPDVVLPHLDLAAHPLLLLMLALYDAVGNALHGLRDEDISRTQLYDRLLGEFVRRQVEKDGPMPPSRVAAAVERELHGLSVIAVSMFHRGAQSINGEEADRDLRALGAATPGAADDSSVLVFGRFFFVHEAQAVVTEERLRSYEFMHATFGEHLAARLIEGALRRLADRHAPWDDGELYALLSFTPLTDRAQVVQNLRDMLAAWPQERSRTALVPALISLFRAASWGPEHRTDLGYAPVRLRRTYRDAVYEANLVLVVVLALGEVYASELVEADGDLAAAWQRHALGWQGQLSAESWSSLSSALVPERCHRGDIDNAQRDIRISTRRRAPFLHHDLDWWVKGVKVGADVPLPDEMKDRLAAAAALDLIGRVSFAGVLDTEIFLHAGYPLLLQVPSAFLRSGNGTMPPDRFRSAAQALMALLAPDVYGPTALPDLYTGCLKHVGLLELSDRTPYMNVVLRQLVHDAPSLSDEALASVMARLHNWLMHDRRHLTPATEQLLLTCLQHALDRESPYLSAPLNTLGMALVRDDDPADERNSPLQSLLRMTRMSHSTHTWRWSGSLRGDTAVRAFDELLADLDLPTTAAAHPRALIDLLRLAAELGLEDWLAAHTAEILAALPTEAFGLLRPSDLPHLRAALPQDAYATEFEEVEWTWRGPEPTAL